MVIWKNSEINKGNRIKYQIVQAIQDKDKINGMSPVDYRLHSD